MAKYVVEDVVIRGGGWRDEATSKTFSDGTIVVGRGNPNSPFSSNITAGRLVIDALPPQKGLLEEAVFSLGTPINSAGGAFNKNVYPLSAGSWNYVSGIEVPMTGNNANIKEIASHWYTVGGHNNGVMVRQIGIQSFETKWAQWPVAGAKIQLIWKIEENIKLLRGEDRAPISFEGEMINRINFGSLAGGRWSSPKQVIIRNDSDNYLTDIRVDAEILTNGADEVEMSYSLDPFIPAETIRLGGVNAPDDDAGTFYVRVKPGVFSRDRQLFSLRCNARVI